MTHLPTMHEHKGWRAYQWPVVWALGIVAFLLGWRGFWNYAVAHGESLTVVAAAYHSLQLFVLHCPHLSHPDWQLETARFLAPAVFGYTATQAFLVIFHQQLQLLCLQFASDHVIVCGLGRKGLQLVEDFRAQNKRVVVIEQDSSNDLGRVARERGAMVLIGDATESGLLERARLRSAAYLFAVTGNDGTNVQIAVCAHESMKKAERTSPGNLRCYVHIVNLDLRNAFKASPTFLQAGEPIEVAIFNTYENSARLLLRDHPLDHVRIGANDPRQVHLIVLGFGQMGQSVVVEAARMGHFANGKKLRVTVVDREASQRKKRFYRWYPQFDKVCDATFVDGDVEELDVLAKVQQWCAEKDAVPNLALCFDDETRCLAVALSILPKLGEVDVPILVRMPNEAGLASLLTAAAGADLARRVHVFGSVKKAAAEVTMDAKLDVYARASHETYRDLRLSKGEKPGSDPSLEPWDKLSEDLKESNRQQADHIPVKLRAIDCRAEPSLGICLRNHGNLVRLAADQA